jgi:DNA-binding transcriptional LysR family regulator
MHHATATSIRTIAPGLVEFAVLARELHMTAAAELLAMPQPTLSRHLARLERELGIPLLLRSGRRMRLTPEGEALRDSVEQALGELDRGLQRILLDGDPGRGRVDLGFMHTLGPVVVPRVIQEFRALRPGIRFELHQEGHETMLAGLRAGVIDVCLTSPMPEDPELATQPLCEQELVCLVPTTHALAGRRVLRLAELSGEPFVGLKPGYGIRGITDAWCGRAGFAPRLMFQGDDIDTVRGLVAAGLGVALLPREPGPLPPGAVEVAVTPRASRTIGVVWARTVPETPPVALFRDFLLDRGSALLRG